VGLKNPREGLLGQSSPPPPRLALNGESPSLDKDVLTDGKKTTENCKVGIKSHKSSIENHTSTNLYGQALMKILFEINVRTPSISKKIIQEILDKLIGR